jgi:hypothetical protein
LPPPGPLARSHYDVLLMHVAVRNVAKWSPAALPSDAPDGWTAALELARRLAGPEPVPYAAFEGAIVGRLVQGALAASRWAGELTADEVLAAAGGHAGVDRLIDSLLRIGAYGDGVGRVADGLTLDRVQAAPHGIDLGPLVPRLPERIAYPDGKLRLAPARIVDDLARLDAWMARAADAPLRLINRRDPRSMNSWLHNAATLAKGPERCTLQIHADDARRRQLRNGQMARLSSHIGSVEVPVEITDAVRPGVVSLPHGFGHEGDGIRLRIATKRAGQNVNWLSDDAAFDVPSGASALFGQPVEVAPVPQSLPPTGGD